jgi:DNA-binding NtrC family response regulator
MARVLIIDDEDGMRTILRRALEHAGHSVIEASNGLEGLKRISQETIDIVVTDLLMPELDGIELIFNLRKSRPNLRVIAISGGGQLPPDSYLKIAQRGGARRILIKPFELRELLIAIEEELKVSGIPAKDPSHAT